MERKMFLNASPEIFANAKNLRNNQTRAEKILWDYLKQKPLGYKFRRQHPLKTYIADFYCHSLKLVIELDGEVHTEEEVLKYDIDRQQFLENMELKFLRFTNSEIENYLGLVIKKIEDYLFKAIT
jgi:cyclase